MINEVLDKLRKATERIDFFKDDDLRIIEVLFKKGKQKQYGLEKNLKESGKAIAHSTVTGKLQRLSRLGLVSSTNENNGLTYYELTP